MPKIGKFKTSFETPQELANFLSGTLIPDLIDSGRYATAHDFMEAIYWLWDAGAIRPPRGGAELGDDSIEE